MIIGCQRPKCLLCARSMSFFSFTFRVTLSGSLRAVQGQGLPTYSMTSGRKTSPGLELRIPVKLIK